MLPTLDPADVTPIQSCFVSQSLLRHAKAAPPRANALTENVEIGVHPRMSPGR